MKVQPSFTFVHGRATAHRAVWQDVVKGNLYTYTVAVYNSLREAPE